MPHKLIIHGGPDAQGVPLYDFSTNANACGPCPEVLAAVQQADATRYPDPAYAALREALGAFHAVAPERIVLAASASECIHRFTALTALQGAQAVSVPRHSYGDYAQAAQARGLVVLRPDDSGWTTAGLQWACEPSSPLGMPDKQLDAWCDVGESVLRVLDCAYAPLRLDGAPLPTQSPGVWQLWTPNKALGLTGVRGAYAIAPQGSEAAVATLGALAPSWPVGAHAAVMLAAWALPDTQNWLAHSRERLFAWKTSQLQLLEAMGWVVAHPGVGNFFCAQPFPPAAVPLVPPLLQALRGHGIKLRDAASFGLPGQVRLAVLSPSAQSALEQAWRTVRSELPKECVDFS